MTCLTISERRKYSTVSMVPLGVADLKYPVEVVARSMIAAAADVLNTSISLKKVEIVIHDDHHMLHVSIFLLFLLSVVN